MSETLSPVTYKYTFGGIVIQCEFELPELVKSDKDTDVEISMGKVPDTFEGADFSKVLVEVKGGEVLLKIPDIAKFLIIDDKKVIVELYNEKRRTDAEKYILSFILGVLSFKKGFYPLHGGGVIHNGEAYLFTGKSGEGKSTTIAGLQQKGFTAVADDISNLFIKDGRVYMHPCFPRFKLWEDAMELLELKDVGEYQLRSDLNKFLVPVLHDFSTEPVPVKCIYLLVEDIKNEYFFKELKGKDKIYSLQKNNYKPWMTKAFKLLQKQFVLMGQMADKIEVKEFHRPKDKKNIQKMYDFLIEDIKK